MIKKYKATNYGKGKIEIEHFDRETDCWLFRQEGRNKIRAQKVTDSCIYCNTFEEAKRWLVDKFEKKILSQKSWLSTLEQQYQEVKNLCQMDA